MNRIASPDRSAGFTLVEMLVALGIFALLAAAGVGVLRSSVDLQESVDARLTDLGSLARLNALLSSDLGQAVVRPSRAPEGVRPAFVGDAGRMEFVAAGRANLDGAPRSDLQRVEWRAAANGLERTGVTDIDGAGSGVPVTWAAKGAAFRYRSLDGSWSVSFSSTEQQPLPSAVELTLTPDSAPPVVMVFALPQGPAPPIVPGQAR